MRNFLAIFLLLLFSVKLFSQEQEDYLGIKELTFNETKYVLVSAKQKSKIQIVQEYIPQDERLEDASNIITLYFFNKEIDAKEAAYHKTEELENRINADKYCNFNVTENPNGTEFVVDFFTSNVPKSKDETLPEKEIIDYNIYRFKNLLIADKSTFLIIGYKEKNEEDAKAYQKSVSKKRNRLLEGIITLNIPSITLTNN